MNAAGQYIWPRGHPQTCCCLDSVSRLAALQMRLLLHDGLVCVLLSRFLLAPAAEAQLWSDIHVSLSDSRSGVVRSVDADHIATVALGAARLCHANCCALTRVSTSDFLQASTAMLLLLWPRAAASARAELAGLAGRRPLHTSMSASGSAHLGDAPLKTSLSSA